MDIDLNELEQLAKAAHKYNSFWFAKDDLEDLNIGGDDAALIARMSHDVVLELVRRLQTAEKTAERMREALQTIAGMQDRAYYKVCPNETAKDAHLIAFGALAEQTKVRQS